MTRKPWPGFKFTPQRLVELVQLGVQLLAQHGKMERGHRAVHLKKLTRRGTALLMVRCMDWGQPDRDPGSGLFVSGFYRDGHPAARCQGWDWQIPRAPVGVKPKNIFGQLKVELTNRAIGRVMSFLQGATLISREEFLCATTLMTRW